MVAWVCSSWRAPRNRNSLVAGGGSGGGAGPALFYTDLSDGPKTGGLNNNGVWVTLFGRGFGATRGTSTVTLGGGEVADYFSWSDTKIVVQLGAAVATGNFSVTVDGITRTGCLVKPYGTTNDFIVRAGSIYFIAATGTNGTGTHASPFVSATNRLRDSVPAGNKPGAIVYFRGGTYVHELIYNGWGNCQLNVSTNYNGTLGAQTAFLGYPGETATLSGLGSCVYFRDGTEQVADFITIANFTMVGQGNVLGGGGQTGAGIQENLSGSESSRVVNCDARATYTYNTQTGLMSMQNNGARFLGNLLRDSGLASFENQNHGIYCQLGASDVDIAFNTFQNLNMGATVQIHTDNFPQFNNVRVHRNTWIGNDTYNMRGIVVGDCHPATTVDVYDNVFYKTGETAGGYGPMHVVRGFTRFHHNTILTPKPGCPPVLINNANGTPTIDIRNNIMESPSGVPYIAFNAGATAAQYTLANNLYNGNGNGPAADAGRVNAAPLVVNAAGGDYRLQAGSPARDVGTSTGLIPGTDFDGLGVSRPQNGARDIGAREYI